MCAYYQDETSKIRKEDHATYQGQMVKILSVKHIKSDKTMEIEYEQNGETRLQYQRRNSEKIVLKEVTLSKYFTRKKNIITKIFNRL